MSIPDTIYVKEYRRRRPRKRVRGVAGLRKRRRRRQVFSGL